MGPHTTLGRRATTAVRWVLDVMRFVPTLAPDPCRRPLPPLPARSGGAGGSGRCAGGRPPGGAPRPPARFGAAEPRSGGEASVFRGPLPSRPVFRGEGEVGER